MIAIKEADVTILVKDMDKAIEFYQNIGLGLKNRWGNHYARMAANGITIGIHPGGDGEQNSGHVSIGFIVGNIDDAKILLDKHKIPFKYAEGKSGKFTHFKDADGTVLYFMQPLYE